MLFKAGQRADGRRLGTGQISGDQVLVIAGHCTLLVARPAGPISSESIHPLAGDPTFRQPPTHPRLTTSSLLLPGDTGASGRAEPEGAPEHEAGGDGRVRGHSAIESGGRRPSRRCGPATMRGRGRGASLKASSGRGHGGGGARPEPAEAEMEAEPLAAEAGVGGSAHGPARARPPPCASFPDRPPE